MTTEWFDNTMKPHHKGLYQVLVLKVGTKEFVEWCYWSGEHWGYACYFKKQALHSPWRTSKGSQKKVWRGLCEKA